MMDGDAQTSEIVEILKAIFSHVKQQIDSSTPKPLEGEALRALEAYQTMIIGRELKYSPDPPAEVSALALGTSEIELSWLEPTLNPEHYEIERSQGRESSTFSTVADVGAQARSWVDRNLAPNTTFKYRVRAVNILGKSAYSATVEAATPPGIGTPKTIGKGG